MNTHIADKDMLVDYLPAVYRREFSGPLKAFLSILSLTFSTVEREIDTVERYFDPLLTPGGDFLNWLAAWVVLKPDAGWSEVKTRRLVKDAAVLYRRRGTPGGLKEMIYRFFDIHVEIEEWTWPRGMELGLHSTIGGSSTLYEKPDPDCCFKITWKPLSRDVEPGLIKKIRALVDLEKPAHTRCYFHLEFPREEEAAPGGMVIGVFSVLGKCFIGENDNKRK